MTILLIIIGVLLLLTLVTSWTVLYILFRTAKKKKSMYFEDYINGSTIMRVYKTEFAYQATASIDRRKILDSGQLSPIYEWVLFEDYDKKGNR